MKYEPAPKCKAQKKSCVKQIPFENKLYCCDGECTNVEVNHK